MIIEDLRVSLETSAVAALIKGKWHAGKIHNLLDFNGNETDDPGETNCIIVQWDDDGRWSPIECEFEPVDAVLH